MFDFLSCSFIFSVFPGQTRCYLASNCDTRSMLINIIIVTKIIIHIYSHHKYPLRISQGGLAIALGIENTKI